MNLDLLKQILAVPSSSGQEEQLVAFVTDHVLAGGAQKCGRCWSDEFNNLYILKGQANHSPCVAAHLDTVFSLKPVEIVEQDGLLVGFDRKGQRSGIGGDDKAGVFICLELLERFDNLAVVLFAGEEVGCVGARQAQAEFFQPLGYVVEFDAPGFGIVSHSCGGQRLFANRGEFILTALPVLERHGATHFQRHPYTDVMAVRERFPLSCLNLSAGYYRLHMPDEYVALDELEAMLAIGEELIQVLGCHPYPFPVGAQDADLPLVKVTGLQVPERQTII
jgi:acetylornithine deacetylase/succinyl-diaminopimelate desuccinylase-like protein